MASWTKHIVYNCDKEKKREQKLKQLIGRKGILNSQMYTVQQNAAVQY
jgi:hypothetical protein